MIRQEVTAYPLAWPEGWTRTELPKDSPFRATPDKARREVVDEIARMGGSSWVLSSNSPMRRDGYPYASKHLIDDPGVAVYFQLKGRPMVLACDKWRRIEDNWRAIAKTIEALRGIERWGSSEMLEKSFGGFTQLAAGPSEDQTREWWHVLGMQTRPSSFTHVRQKRNELARTYHPDIGEQPNEERMIEINAAFERAQEEMT